MIVRSYRLQAKAGPVPVKRDPEIGSLQNQDLFAGLLEDRLSVFADSARPFRRNEEVKWQPRRQVWFNKRSPKMPPRKPKPFYPRRFPTKSTESVVIRSYKKEGFGRCTSLPICAALVAGCAVRQGFRSTEAKLCCSHLLDESSQARTGMSGELQEKGFWVQ